MTGGAHQDETLASNPDAAGLQLARGWVDLHPAVHN
jgi:hypothetical protein